MCSLRQNHRKGNQGLNNTMRVPVVELSDCVMCGICESVCPSVFNLDMGYVSVADLPEYPESEVDEVIKNCPADCVWWSEN
jgi:ferredoxin